jgi:predicted nucleic acid-binding protein
VGAPGHVRRAVALDAGALIALESPRGRALFRQLATSDQTVVISGGALAQAWRDGSRQALLGALLKRECTVVSALDTPAAKACGHLLARTGSSDAIDAHVVVSAREHGAASIVTSDADDLRALDPSVEIFAI